MRNSRKESSDRTLRAAPIAMDTAKVESRPLREQKKHSLSARKRVLDAFRERRDWQLVAKYNGIPPTTARRIVDFGRAELLPRGGVRASSTKCTAAALAALQGYIEESPSYTLESLRSQLAMDHDIALSDIDDQQKAS